MIQESVNQSHILGALLGEGRPVLITPHLVPGSQRKSIRSGLLLVIYKINMGMMTMQEPVVIDSSAVCRYASPPLFLVSHWL